MTLIANPNSARPVLSIGKKPLALAAFKQRIKLVDTITTAERGLDQNTDRELARHAGAGIDPGLQNRLQKQDGLHRQSESPTSCDATSGTVVPNPRAPSPAALIPSGATGSVLPRSPTKKPPDGPLPFTFISAGPCLHRACGPARGQRGGLDMAPAHRAGSRRGRTVGAAGAGRGVREVAPADRGERVSKEIGQGGCCAGVDGIVQEP
jgi:hypothetical protein